MQVIVPSATGIGTFHEALPHVGRLLLKVCTEDLVEGRARIEQEDCLLFGGKGEAFRSYAVVSSRCEPHAVAQLDAVIAWIGLLGLLEEPDVIACRVRHQGDVSAATTSANSRESVDAEA